MKNLIIYSSTSSIVNLHNTHHILTLSPQKTQTFTIQTPISLPYTKPTSSTPPSASSSPPSLLNSPHFVPSSKNHAGFIDNINHYAEIASKHVKDGSFEEFGLVVEFVSRSGFDGVLEFGKLLDFEVMKEGVVNGLNDGRVKDVVGLLGWFGELGVDVLGLFDIEFLKRECIKIVNDGDVVGIVEILEVLAGFQFPIRELVKSSDMINMFVNKRSPSLAVRYICLLPHADILFCTIIHEFGKKKDLASALSVFEASKLKMSGDNMYVYRSIIDVCGLRGDCFKSRLIYEDLLAQKVTPNIFVFNSLMNVNAHDLTYTMEVYQQMQNLGVVADMTSYNILLKACCLSGRVDLAQDIYREVQCLESTGALKMDVFTYSTIIKVFADAKLWQLAIKVKDDMLSAGVNPNAVTWSSLINACAKTGLVDQATHLFEEMLMAGCRPNSQCLNALLHAYVEGCQYDRAFRLFNTWRKSSGSSRSSLDDSKDTKNSNSSIPLIGDECSTSTSYYGNASCHLSFSSSVPFRPTTSTYNILLKACGADLYRAKALIDEMRVLGLSPNHVSWTILIDICGARGNVNGALQILKSMNESGLRPDVVAYTTAIKVCVENKKLKAAFSLFAEMKRYRIKPNIVTYNTLLRVHRRYGSLQEIQQCLAIYQDMRRAGYKSNDYYLKQLVEEWCEEVIQRKNHGGQSNSCNKADIRGLRSLFLERVATHLQKNTTESLAVDIQGLTKVEARIVVLAVLRMLKENLNHESQRVKDDLIIVLGKTQIDAECMVIDAIVKLLKHELGLEVTSVKPTIQLDRATTDSNSNGILETNEASFRSGTPRRPAALERLLVSKKSLNIWLHRRPSASAKSE